MIPSVVARQVRETVLDYLRTTFAFADGAIEAAFAESSICIGARSGTLLSDRYAAMLAAEGIAAVMVNKDPESEMNQAGIRLATMHRMKGLEFSRVILASVQDGVVPYRGAAGSTEPGADAHELLERCLLYVAATRARDELVMTGYGGRSPLIA